jgi:hypothetical protein
MATFTLQENNDSVYGVLPVDTIIEVEVEDVSQREVPGRDGKEGWTKLEFKFLIKSVPTALEDEYGSLVGSRIWGSVGARFTEHPDNKLRQWSEALLNLGSLTVGFELDTDMLIGRRARGQVGQYNKRDGSQQHQIIGLLPLAAAMAPAAASLYPEEAPF